MFINREDMTYRIFQERDEALKEKDQKYMFRMKYVNPLTDWIAQDLSKDLGWSQEMKLPVDFSNYVDWSRVKYRFPTYLEFYSKGNLYKHIKDCSFALPFRLIGDDSPMSDLDMTIIHDIPKDGTLWFLKLDAEYSYGGYDVYPIIADEDMRINIEKNILKSKEYRLYRKSRFVLQKGVDHPCLIEGRKFDLRVFYLVVSVRRKISFFVCKESLIRMSAVEYDDTSTDKSIQITNTTYGYSHATEESAHEDEEPEEGKRKRKLTDLMKEDNPLYPKVYSLCAELSAIYKPIFLSEREPRFYVFGLDIIFDREGKPYLEEANIRPTIYRSVAESQEKHGGIEARLVEAIGINVVQNVLNGRIPTRNFGFWHRVL